MSPWAVVRIKYGNTGTVPDRCSINCVHVGSGGDDGDNDDDDGDDDV